MIISWAGMRGILSLAAAMALPPVFPYRDLIVLTAFSVVVGTLLIQGLTLKPPLRALDLHDDDPVGRELSAARERALRAGLATFEHDRSPRLRTQSGRSSQRVWYPPAAEESAPDTPRTPQYIMLPCRRPAKPF